MVARCPLRFDPKSPTPGASVAPTGPPGPSGSPPPWNPRARSPPASPGQPAGRPPPAPPGAPRQKSAAVTAAFGWLSPAAPDGSTRWRQNRSARPPHGCRGPLPAGLWNAPGILQPQGQSHAGWRDWPRHDARRRPSQSGPPHRGGSWPRRRDRAGRQTSRSKRARVRASRESVAIATRSSRELLASRANVRARASALGQFSG